MKKNSVLIKFIFCLIVWPFIFIMVSIFGCRKETNTESDVSYENPFNFVGYYHNTGLDFVLQTANLKNNNLQTTSDSIIFISKKVYDFLLTIDDRSILSPSLSNMKIESYTEKLVSGLNSKSSLYERLSDTQLHYLDKIRGTFRENSDSDSTKVFKLVAGIEKEVLKSRLNQEEKALVLVAAAVGKFSWLYWSEDKIKKNFKQDGKSINAEDWWKRLKLAVLEADIDGAIVGMIAGCIGGAIFGSVIMPGLGTISSCIAEAVNAGFYGAVIGSTLGAIKFIAAD